MRSGVEKPGFFSSISDNEKISAETGFLVAIW